MGQEELSSESQKLLGFFDKFAGLLDHPGDFFRAENGVKTIVRLKPSVRGIQQAAALGRRRSSWNRLLADISEEQALAFLPLALGDKNPAHADAISQGNVGNQFARAVNFASIRVELIQNDEYIQIGFALCFAASIGTVEINTAQALGVETLQAGLEFR
jgi:hypothetical protein